MLENIGSKTRFDLSISHVRTLRHVNTDCSQDKNSLFGITSAFTSKILEKSRGRYSIACHLIPKFLRNLNALLFAVPIDCSTV